MKETIRSHGVSIVRLEKQAVSLEDAFLKIVEDPEGTEQLKKYLS